MLEGYTALGKLVGGTDFPWSGDIQPEDLSWDRGNAFDEQVKKFISKGWWPLAAAPEDTRDEIWSTSRRVGLLVCAEGCVAELFSDRVVVQLDPAMPPAQSFLTLATLGLTEPRPLRFCPGLFEGRVRDFREKVQHFEQARNLFEEIESATDGGWVEPVLLVNLDQRKMAPIGPPPAAVQWHWTITKADEAWQQATGEGVRVSVVDKGFFAGHDDLKKAIHEQATGTIQPLSDLVPGSGSLPINDHGTKCAGMVGARRGAPIGNGAAPECDLGLIALPTSLEESQVELARAIAFAVDPGTELLGDAPANHGADIISCSLGPQSLRWRVSKALRCALEFAGSHGRLQKDSEPLGTAIFWATMNTCSDIAEDEVVTSPGVTAVAQSDSDDYQVSSPSGARLDLLAPGYQVSSTAYALGANPSYYATAQGSSLAAPAAAGVAALLLQKSPSLTRKELEQVLKDSCDPLKGNRCAEEDGGEPPLHGPGRINALSALMMLEP